MQIQLTQVQQQRLALHAEAAGYVDVEEFVTAQLSDIAGQPTTDELPTVDGSTARALIRQGEEEIAAGKTQDMEQAFLDLGRRRGYQVEE